MLIIPMPHKDPEAKKKYFVEYRLKNKDRLNAYHREYYKRPDAKQKKQEYALKTREDRLEYLKEYRQRPGNKEKFNNYFKNWYKERSKKDPHFKIKCRLSHRVYLALKSNGIVKSKKTLKLLGCTMAELWQHLESKFQSGMTKENYGKWHVDHIRPCASFDLTKIREQEKCFHYTNLQPLWAKDNVSKGAKWNG